MREPCRPSASQQEDEEEPRALPDWMQRYPGLAQFLQQPEDVLEGVSVEPPATSRHVYTLDLLAGETIRAGERVCLEGDRVVHWAPGTRLLGIALARAEAGESVRVQISEVRVTH